MKSTDIIFVSYFIVALVVMVGVMIKLLPTWADTKYIIRGRKNVVVLNFKTMIKNITPYDYSKYSGFKVSNKIIVCVSTVAVIGFIALKLFNGGVAVDKEADFSNEEYIKDKNSIIRQPKRGLI